MIAVAVSRENGCDSCVSHHPEALSRYLRDPAALEQVCCDCTRADLAPADRAILDYVLCVLDVLTIVAVKTLSNYTNHLAGTPLDSAFVADEWHGKSEAA